VLVKVTAPVVAILAGTFLPFDHSVHTVWEVCHA
jgi:hypothetical protein